jgi:hypothetical protein
MPVITSDLPRHHVIALTGRQPARSRRPQSRLVRLATFVAGTFAALIGTAVLAAGPAAAAVVAIGEKGDPGGKLPWQETLAIYLGIPVAVAAIIAFLVVLPSMVSGPRYRPGRPWLGGASWFGAPAGGEAAAEAITVLPPATANGGGASARW